MANTGWRAAGVKAAGVLVAAIALSAFGPVAGQAAGAQVTPAMLLGTWRIARVLPTHNPACWDAERARTLLGVTLHYEPRRMTLGSDATDLSGTLSRTLSARKFSDEYKVTLAELGIRAPAITELDLQHEDADVTGATTEVPGDTVVLAGLNRIIVSACGVFYEAVRTPARR